MAEEEKKETIKGHYASQRIEDGVTLSLFGMRHAFYLPLRDVVGAI